MIKALIADDQSTNITVLENQLKKFFPSIAIAGVTTDPFDVKNLVETLQPDLLFLDIHMPGLNGFELLKQFRETTPAQIIFVTAYSEYALKAFEHQAAGYITKPVNAEQFILTVNKALELIQTRQQRDALQTSIDLLSLRTPKKLALPTQKGLVFVDPETIYYCESSGNYTTFFQENNQQLVVSKQIGQIEQLLPRQSFMRIHDRFIVNLKLLKAYLRGNGGTVVLENGKELPVSARRKEFLLKHFG